MLRFETRSVLGILDSVLFSFPFLRVEEPVPVQGTSTLLINLFYFIFEARGDLVIIQDFRSSSMNLFFILPRKVQIERTKE